MIKVKDCIFNKEDLTLLGKTGVYKIYHVKFPNKFYIGSASSDSHYKESQRGFYRRFIQHLNMLKKNSHHSQYLQNVINKHGIEGLKFEIIEVCDKNETIIREQYYIDTLNSCYNMCKTAGNTSGRVQSLEERRKRSESLKGKPLPDEIYDKIKRVVYQYSKQGILIKKYTSMSEASKDLRIDRGSINNCALGKRKTAGGYIWSFVKGVSPILPNRIIYQYDLNGKLIRTYNSLEEVKKELNLTSSTAIRNCFVGKQYKAYGYRWVDCKKK